LTSSHEQKDLQAPAALSIPEGDTPMYLLLRQNPRVAPTFVSPEPTPDPLTLFFVCFQWFCATL
jgi:hypothetical protein